MSRAQHSASSSVDETLFASKSAKAKFAESQGATVGHGRRAPQNNINAQGKETIEIVTKDGIRKLIVPSANAGPTPLVLTRHEYARLQMNSVSRTKSAVMRERKEAFAAQEELTNASSQRKKDAARSEASVPHTLTEADIEAKQRNEALLLHARRMIEEQEDEIKKMNDLIAQAKVYAIRDAQLAEKEAIKNEMYAEERRLDNIMEHERVRALEEYESRDMKLRVKMLAGAKDIRVQINQRETQRLLDEELREQETTAMMKLHQLQLGEEREQEQKKIAKGKAVLLEAAAITAESVRLKTLMQDALKLEDAKSVEFMKQKIAREEALENDKALAKSEKDREMSRLLGLQEAAQDKVAERQAVAARRQADEVERLWRRKEETKAAKDVITIKALTKGRDEQLAFKSKFVDAQMAHDKNEFQSLLEAQKISIAADETKNAQLHAHRRKHEASLREQISEKERLHMDERKAFFEEGVKLDFEAQNRRARLDEIKTRKLAELAELGIDGKYLGPVKRLVAASASQEKFSH